MKYNVNRINRVSPVSKVTVSMIVHVHVIVIIFKW